MEKIQKPFSKSYVLRTTTKHMRKSIDISIRKTFERIKEFSNEGETPSEEKSREVFETLQFLHRMRKDLDDLQHQNSDSFRGE
jgi:hypothetical protein